MPLPSALKTVKEVEDVVPILKRVQYSNRIGMN